MTKTQCKLNTFFIFSKYSYINIRSVFFDFQKHFEYRKEDKFFINNFNILDNLVFMFSRFKSYKNSFQNFYNQKSNVPRLKTHVIRLYLKGIGYKFLRVKKFSSFLRVELGYSISIYLRIPQSIRISTKRDKIIIVGSNYFNVNNFSKRIFNLRPADVYKGKGVRYSNIKYITFKPGKRR